MAESEEDLHSEGIGPNAIIVNSTMKSSDCIDSNISDEYEDSSNMSMSTSNSSDQEEGDDVFRPMSYSSDSSSLPSSQQHWQQENKNPTLKVCICILIRILILCSTCMSYYYNAHEV